MFYLLIETVSLLQSLLEVSANQHMDHSVDCSCRSATFWTGRRGAGDLLPAGEAAARGRQGRGSGPHAAGQPRDRERRGLGSSTPPGTADRLQEMGCLGEVGNAMVGSCRPEKGSQLQDPLDGVPSGVHPDFRARFAALKPTGKITERFIAPNPVTLRIGEDSVRSRGVLPEHVEYGLNRINRVGARLAQNQPPPRKAHPKERPPPSTLPRPSDGCCDYSHNNPAECNCDQLERTLAMLPGVSRMIMGHTIQEEGG